jgi:mono/diheme cytochrome c family protein
MSQTDLEVTHRIREGREPLMPAYRDKLSREEVLALAIYVRAFSVKPTVVAATPEPSPAVPSAPVAPAPAAPREARPSLAEVSAQMSPTQVYRAYCMACHDTDGRGKLVRAAMPEIPDFADTKWQEAHSDAELERGILEGKGKFMLPMKDKLGQADAKRMVAHVRGFRRGEKVVVLEHLEPLQASPSERPAVVALPAAPSTLPVPPPIPSTLPVPAAPAAAAAHTNIAASLYRQFCLTCHGVDGKGTEMRAALPVIPDFTNRARRGAETSSQLVAIVLDGKGAAMPAFRGRLGAAEARDLVAYVRAFGGAGPPAGPPGTPPNDFETQFRRLQRQWDELENQMRAVSPTRR